MRRIQCRARGAAGHHDNERIAGSLRLPKQAVQRNFVFRFDSNQIQAVLRVRNGSGCHGANYIPLILVRSRI